MDTPNGTDIAHHQNTVCSNMGTCDTHTGLCKCEPGFMGDACEKMRCPGWRNRNECNGHGRCMSMASAARTAAGSSSITYSQWDHDMIFGCVCDAGYGGYDCTRRDCPRGDDPYTTQSQPDEVQLLECTCNGCAGHFSLRMRGHTSVSIAYSATATDLKTALEALPTVRGVSLVLTDAAADGAGAICDATGAVTAITFAYEPGDLPALEVFPGINASPTDTVSISVITGGASSAQGGAASVDGAREDAECSNRGECKRGAAFSECACWPGFASSDGSFNPALSSSSSPCPSGSVGDCSHVTGQESQGTLVAAACPIVPIGDRRNGLICAGHGTCVDAATAALTGATPTYLCDCLDPWMGPSCDRLKCPTGRAWFDVATATDTGTYVFVDVGVGNCLDDNGNSDQLYYEKAATTLEDCKSDCNNAWCHGIAWVQHANGNPAWCKLYAKAFGPSLDAVGAARMGGATFNPIGGADGAANRRCFRAVLAAANAHADGVECSSAGTCDHSTGVCRCDSRFEGRACGRLKCTQKKYPCTKGRGVCVSIEELGNGADVDGTRSPRSYGASDTAATWDHSMMQGCRCRTPTQDAHTEAAGGRIEFIGHDCGLIRCPTGDDPVTTPQVDEQQKFTCSLSSGYFQISFRPAVTDDGITFPLRFDSTVTTVKTAIEALMSIGKVTVIFSAGDVACSAAGVDVTIVFLTEHGDLPLLTLLPISAGTWGTAEVVKGTKEDAECSGRGICNRQNGLCKCFLGYGSSDGMGGPGVRGDCGHVASTYKSR